MTRCATYLAHAALATLVCTSTTAVFAQVQRNFPAHALRGEMTVVAGPEVRLNGQPARLAPGARIRDAQNMLVMSGTVAGTKHAVNYTLESNGLVLDVWLLRPEEQKRQPWPRTEAEAKSWVFDPVGQSWSKR